MNNMSVGRSWSLWLLPPVLLLALINGSFGGFELLLEADQRSLLWAVVSELRLPRVMLAAVVGAGLGLAGLLLQTLSRNPLADTGILGINQGAALLVVLALLYQPALPPHWLPLIGAVGAIATMLLLWKLSRSCSAQGLLLMGVALSSLLAALIGCLMILAERQQLAMVLTWLAGSFSSTNVAVVQSTLLWSAFLLPVGLLLCRQLSPWLLDDLSSHALSARTPRLELLALLVTSALCAVAVTAAGTLSFVGLLSPHLARLSDPPAPAALALPCMAWGAVLCVLADLLGRSLFAPIQLPAGLMLALVGVPLFILLLLWRQRMEMSR